MSFDSLRIGASGLSAAQKGVDVAGHNVANVNTPGYTRQRVVLAAGKPAAGVPGVPGDGMRGTGVTVVDLQRMRSAFADAAWRGHASTAADAAITGKVLTRVESLMGDINNNLTVAVNQLYAAFSALSTTPSDPAAREGVLSAAATVASQLNTLATEMRQIGPDSTSSAVDVAARANLLAGQVAKLNTGIADAITSGQQPSDLMDARDQALDELATLVGARSGNPDAQGRVDVYLGGEPLVRGASAYTLAVTGTATGPTVAFADGRNAILGGTLGGLVRAATETVPDIVSRFDAWAADFADKVNTVHAAGFGLDGVSGRPLFDGITASSIRVNPTLTPDQVAASASGAAADGNNALRLSQVRDLKDAANTTVGDRLRGEFSHVGLLIQKADIAADSTAHIQDGLEQSRLVEHSVSTDEEMVDMVRYQRAYEAAARVVSIADQLLDVLINRTGR